MNYFNVAVVGGNRGGNATLTYSSSESVVIGDIVTIPIGKKTATGVVIRTTEKPSFQTKQLQKTALNPIDKQYLALADWIAQYYASDLNATLQTMLPRGLTKQRRSPFSPQVHDDQTGFIELSDNQQQLVSDVVDSNQRSHLLHGATGSGKTHIYLSLIKQAIDNNKSAILLVPEIGLSRHLLDRIRPLLSVPLVEMSSDLTEAQRHARWNFIRDSKQPVIVVGPRSAVFAPLQNLGIIIVDEAHDSSFIETSRPHYDATFVAAKRCELNDAKLVLGTATPNISQRWLAEDYLQLHSLPSPHYNKTSQSITVVPLNDRSQFKQDTNLSTPLLNSIARSLDAKKQSLLFINKRGYSHATQCMDCGWIMECATCQLPAVYHRNQHSAQCHTCGRKYTPPSSCPDCNSTEIRLKRAGTQRIEEDVQKIFPKAKIVRADRDQQQSDTSLRSADILIGTQLLIKGFDLPNLTTVGVLHADSGLGLPDYNASETVYQQLRQVIGRNNRRGTGGNTIVQALQPEHHAVKTAITNDYELFYQIEIDQRRERHYPPFTHLMLIKARYKTDGKAQEKLSTAKSQIDKNWPDTITLGPSPALRQHAFGYNNWQLLVKSTQRAALVEIATEIQSKSIDTHINPPSLL